MNRRALLLLLVAALPAFAGDDEVELKLLPKAKKGVAEEIAFDIGATYGDESESLTGKMRREIRAVDEQGLPETEQIELLSSDYRHKQQYSSYSTSGTVGTKTIKRSGKSRLASESICDLSHVTFKHVKDLTTVLQRDPDALVRAIEPEDKMKVDDRWEVDPKDVLLAVVGSKVKLVEEGTKAVATLESVRKKDDASEASISFKATIYYTTKDDPDTKCKLIVTATLKGPFDGSAAPRKMKVDITQREGEEKKLSLHISFERTPQEKGGDESKDDDEPKKKKKAKKDDGE